MTVRIPDSESQELREAVRVLGAGTVGTLVNVLVKRWLDVYREVGRDVYPPLICTHKGIPAVHVQANGGASERRTAQRRQRGTPRGGP